MWGDRRAWDTRIRLYVLWMRMWGDRGWVAENKVVCCEKDVYMGRSTPVGTRERGCMYCDWGVYVGRSTPVG